MMEGIDFARDRISDLPDPLLIHILSFLPTEEAVRTCILAKRWIKVWASLPVLIFYDHITEEEYRKREAKFVRFLGSVIFHRENITLDTLKLTRWKNERDTVLYIFEFLCFAVKCRPRVLSILIDGCTFFDLPDSICTCTSVEEMSLWLRTDDYLYKDNILKPRSINLPFLKNLELGYVSFNDDIMRMLISGCPILEELVLIECYLEVNLISFNALKKLVLKDCSHYEPMEISCPGLVSLSINYSLEDGGITLKNMSSLAMADICFESRVDALLHDLRLLSGLSNVTSLKLYTGSLHVMDLLLADIPNCPTLKNLKSLDLGALDFDYDWGFVECLLEHSSNLKDLTLHLFRSYDSDEEEFQQEISFQHECLEAVKIICEGKNVKLVEELVHHGEVVMTTAKIIIL